ncbi:MAG TPA: cupin domain-containing protein [Vicinamibacterales bacterium]|nr:cupin domain-containing protein [Vicinamibacterales bacterium]
MKTIAAVVLGMSIGAAAMLYAQPAKVKGGFIVQHDADIAKNEPGTHDGGGQTIGYSFFDKTPGMKFVFRKRALHPGAGVGHHEQHEDEVYYVLSGKGVMTVDGTPVDMTPGTAVLTRPGSTHSLKQMGPDDLVVLISYEIK